MNNYAMFGAALAQAVRNNSDENAVWREVVAAHMRLGITDHQVIQLARQLVEDGLRSK